MGRPIKKEFIGGTNVPSGSNMVVIDSAFIPGSSDISNNVKIISQKGTGRYIVTDGNNTGMVKLVDGSNGYIPVDGEAISKVNVYQANPESETKYTPSSLKLNLGGDSYKVGDIITVPNTGTFEVKTVSDVVIGGMILTGTPTLSTTQYTINNSGDAIPGTGGTGTGATFKIETSTITTYLPKNVSLNAAGTGYAVNDTITLTNIGVLTVTAVGDNGVITTYTSELNATAKDTDMAGTGISQQKTSGTGTGATFDVTSTSSTIYPIKSATLVSAGTGYSVNDNLSIGGGTATFRIETVSVADNGGKILTGTSNLLTETSSTDMSGTKIPGTGGTGTGATFDVTSTSSTIEISNIAYASKIFNRTVVTFEDGVYSWKIDSKANKVGEADITIIQKQ